MVDAVAAVRSVAVTVNVKGVEVTSSFVGVPVKVRFDELNDNQEGNPAAE